MNTDSAKQETWNTCPNCWAKWKDEKATPQLLHRTRLCSKCADPLNKVAMELVDKLSSLYWKSHSREFDVSATKAEQEAIKLVLAAFKSLPVTEKDLRSIAPELTDSFPLVLYFADEKEKNDFVEVVRSSHPNLLPRSL